MTKTCGSWWCNYTTERSRKIDGVIVCGSCYQYVWEQAKKTGESLAVVFRKVEPPKRIMAKKRTKCSRSGCEVVLTPSQDSSKYRRLNNKPICRNCYQTTWEYKEKHGLGSMEEAFSKLYPKGWQPPPSMPVECVMAWCKNMISKRALYLLEGEQYVCGSCKMYLHMLSRRHHQTEHDWKWYAISALRGMVPAPGTPEYCVAKWCNAKVVGKTRFRGPNGEPICNADSLHFYNYAKKKGITFAEAFQTAPAPRLLHIRGRAS